MAKRRNLAQMAQLHGKLEPELDKPLEDKYEPTSLSQLWGDDGFAKYKTFDRDKYKQELDEMNSADLRSHAAKLGILPIPNRDRLTKRLLIEFSRYTSQFQKPKNILDKSPSRESIQIMKEVIS